MPKPLTISAAAQKRLRSGHLWVFRDEIQNPKPELDGMIAGIEGPAGEFLGQGFYSHSSKIGLRLLTESPEALGREFFVQKIRHARQKRGDKISPESAARLINAEGDGFPGLVADWYAGHLVIQCLVPGTDRLGEMLADILWEEFQPAGLWFRNDASGRALEGLAEEKFFWKGNDDPRVTVREGGVSFAVHLMEGHKTGAYLDQAENRVRAGELARGRCLDAFTFQGGFALHLAGKAEEVIAVDSSAPALEILEKNLELNGIKNVKVARENIFDLLPEMEREKLSFDLIVLDPPPFAKSKKDLPAARRGYLEINLRALRLLNPGGTLLTYSCSYNFPVSELVDTLRRALGDARRRGTLKELQGQASDHPILLNMPETWYLKGLVLEVE